MNDRRLPIFRLLILMTGLIVPAALARGQSAGKVAGPFGTQMAIGVGWGGMVQPGRWHPVYLTLSHPVSKAVVVEFAAPHGSFLGMRSHQPMTIGPQPQTFIVYMPLGNFSAEDLAFVVRDAVTGKRLADISGRASAALTGAVQVPIGQMLIGISGRRATLKPVTDALPGARLTAAHLEQEGLPPSAVGYDCLDVLVLNGPDFAALGGEPQQAIVEWVRSGGNLIVWPGDTPVPDASPLLDALPCRIGNTEVVELTPEELRKAGLTQRFAKLPARELVPAGGAESFTLLGSEKVRGYVKRLGLGRVVVCPIDLASLQMNDAQATWALWRVVLKGMVRRMPNDPTVNPEQTYDATAGEALQREGNATRQVGDLLGNVPGAGQFGFGYVAGILIGMMVIVGPLDWFLLKRLGRQPWTWATTSGWIALVTLAAVYAGHLFKSGELYFRTFELADQADGVVVARTAMTGLYSPRTTEYTVEARPDAWWQPASPGDQLYGYRGRGAQEIAFTQSYRGSTPDPMVVNVWNLRFLRGDVTTPSPSVVEAGLRVEQREVKGRPREFVVGTIRNLGNEPLVHIAVRTQAGWAVPFGASGSTRPAEPLRVGPGETAKVDAMIDPAPVAAEQVPGSAQWQRAHDPYYGANVEQIDPARMWDRGGDLSMRRTDKIEQWVVERGDLGCVYAECEQPGAAAELKGGGAVERHWKVVRALVELGK